MRKVRSTFTGNITRNNMGKIGEYKKERQKVDTYTFSQKMLAKIRLLIEPYFVETTIVIVMLTYPKK